METPNARSNRRAATLAGVFVELFDAHDHCLGQALYFDWPVATLPAPGETISLAATQAWTKRRQLAGRVRKRQFDVQQDDAGRPCVWVRIELEHIPYETPSRPRPQDKRRATGLLPEDVFSSN
ncbi:MAG: hypothetical protein K1X74_16220 [Pirellulales bacterium]|nr:hypothetical protein [Pirellulales bacterium]